MLRVCLLQCAAAITLLTPSPTARETNLKTLSYIAMDSKYSEQAVRTLIEVMSRLNPDGDNFRATELLRLVNLKRIDEYGDCNFVYDSAVVHLTSTCLPNYAFGLKTPVLSLPTQFGNDSNQLTHVSFADDDCSELLVLLDVAKKMNWTSAVYVSDINTDTRVLDRLLRYRRSFDIHDVVSVSNEVDPSSLLARIENDNVDFVLVHCRSYWCYGVVKKLLVLRDDSGSSMPWLMTEALTRKARNDIVDGPLVIHSTTYGLQKALPKDPLSAILLNDVPSLETSHSRCYTLDHCSTTLQQQLEVLNFYDALVVLFDLAAKDNGQRTLKHSVSLVELINKANVEGMSGPIQFDHFSSRRSYPALYNVLEISQFLVAKIGVYDTSKSAWLHDLMPLDGKHTAKRRRHKRAAKKCDPAVGTYKVTTIREPPFVIYDPNNTLKEEAHNGPFAGFVVDMMESLKKKLGFTYTMSEPTDMKYGLINENGEGNGMVGELMNCRADLAAAAMAITSARSEHIYFTKPYIDSGKTLLTYKGEAKRTGMWAFLNPFDVTTRIVVVICFIAVSAIFAVLGRLNPYCKEKESESTDSHRRLNVTWPENSLWFLYTTAMQQGPDVIPSLSGKVLVAGWFFFCLVMIATYTANLAAFLTVKSFEDTIQSVDDLAAQTEIIYGTVNDSSVIEFFRNSPIAIHKTMYTFMTNTDDALVNTVEEAYDRVHKGNYVFIWDEPILDYTASHDPCKSQVVGRSFNSQGYGIAMPKGMPYARNFTLGILKMRESAEVDKLRAKWLHSKQCSSSGTIKDLTEAEEVEITDLLGVFVILGVTVGASLLIALLELLWWRRKKQRKVDVTALGQVPDQV